MVAEIPIIALSQPRDTLVAAIRTAYFSHGFFQVMERPLNLHQSPGTYPGVHGGIIFSARVLPEDHIKD